MKTRRIILAVAMIAFLVSGTDATASGRKKIRLIDYNIQNGMWYDQFNNYDRFVDWVNKQAPDILAICEGASSWDKDKKHPPITEPRYLPDSLHILARRWGHKYTVIGPYQDNYPVAFTSRYPIETVQKIGGDVMSHGALHVKIKGINYVVLHLWPQKYSKGDKTRSDGKGDEYRIGEIENVLNLTIRNPKFAKEKHWVMTGDFNTVSAVDSIYYKNRSFAVQNVVRSAYPHDVIAETYPNQFQPSNTKGTVRIDYIYTTEEIFRNMVHAETIRDEFTDKASDHRPVLMDFVMPKRRR